MLLKDLLKQEGRTQKYLREQLELQGVKRDQSQISHWCNGVYSPKDTYIHELIARIIGVATDKVTACFPQN